MSEDRRILESRSNCNNRRQHKNATPRVIKKLIKPPPLNIPKRTNIPKDEVCMSSPIQASNQHIGSVTSDILEAFHSLNILHTTEECSTTKHLQMEYSNRDSFSSGISRQENTPPSNKFSALQTNLKSPLNIIQEPSQSDAQNILLPTCTQINQQNEKSLSLDCSTNIQQVVDVSLNAIFNQNSQNWSLSKELWPTDGQVKLKEMYPSLYEESYISTNIYTDPLCATKEYSGTSPQIKTQTSSKTWILSEKLWPPDQVSMNQFNLDHQTKQDTDVSIDKQINNIATHSKQIHNEQMPNQDNNQTDSKVETNCPRQNKLKLILETLKAHSAAIKSATDPSNPSQSF